MRLAILSDIHGNLPALDAVLADMERQPPVDAVGVAGDLCEGGPEPRAVLARVRALGCPVVQGNNDYYLTIANDRELRALGKKESAIADIAWTRRQLEADDVAYLAALPVAHTFAGPQGQDVLMVHANARDLETHLRPDASPGEVAYLLEGTTAPVVVFGHLHVSYVRLVAGRFLVDAASVGHPKDGDRRAAYAILHWDGAWHATIHRVPYDLHATATLVRACGMPEPERHITTLYEASYDSR